MKYKILITFTDNSKYGIIQIECYHTFKSYSAAEEFYSDFDFDSWPADIKIKRLYQ